VVWRPDTPVSDPGTGWHLKLGELLWQERVLPAHDPLSYTASDRPWIDYQWLTHFFMGALLQAGGTPLVTAVWTFLYALIPLLLYRQCLRENAAPLPAFLLAFTAYLVLTMHLQNRPHAFSYLFACLLIGLLREFQREPGRRWRLVVLPPLFLAWTQLHAGFVAGLLILASYAAGLVLQSWREKRPGWPRLARDLAAAGMLCGLATLANPYGIGLHLQILKLLSSPIASMWNEFQAPFLHNTANVWLFYLVAAAFLFALAKDRLRLDWGGALCALVLLAFACKSVRHVNLFVLAALPVIAASWARHSEAFWNRWTPAWRDMALHEKAPTPAALWCSLAGAALLGLGLLRSPLFAPDVIGPNLPREALRWLQEHPEERGPMFNSDNLGGSLAYAFGPEWKLFMDDRLDLYGTAFFQNICIPVMNGEPHWEEILDSYHVRLAIFASGLPLNERMEASPLWEKAWSGGQVVIFRRVAAPGRAP
jgi:hypothetical protein